MRRNSLRLAAILLASGIGIGSANAKPGGCLKYGAAGAVAGHVAHHHAVLGATGGCAVGMYRRHKYNKQQRLEAKQRKEEMYRHQQGLNTSGH